LKEIDPIDALIERYKSAGLLGNLYFVSFATPLVERAKMLEAHSEHLAFQKELELAGMLFGAGPLLNDEATAPSGGSMTIYRVASLAEARSIAERDPMNQQGRRSFRIRPWIMNEGSLKLDLKFTNRSIDVR
jgi:uncharacterized protein YciI